MLKAKNNLTLFIFHLQKDALVTVTVYVERNLFLLLLGLLPHYNS